MEEDVAQRGFFLAFPFAVLGMEPRASCRGDKELCCGAMPQPLTGRRSAQPQPSLGKCFATGPLAPVCEIADKFVGAESLLVCLALGPKSTSRTDEVSSQ